jgi:uncharacterized membrane-anchored protein
MKHPAAARCLALDRIPKTVRFGAAALIQVGLIVMMVADRAWILRTGTDVMLHTRPVDPRDFLRGDYVQLGYDISQVPAGALEGQPAGNGDRVYVTLAPDRDGFHQAISVHTAPVVVTSPEVLIQGHVLSGAGCGPNHDLFCANLQIRYNLERYFVPEGEGGKLEQARNQRKVAVVAAVAPSGRAAIKRLMIDGEPAYEEPWF